MAKSARAYGAPFSRDRSGGWSDATFLLAGDEKTASCDRPVLLWIDDFRPGLEMYKAMFENMGFRVLTAASGREGLGLVALNRIDVVVTDYEMPEMNGESVAAAVKAIKPQVPVLIFSGSTLVSRRARRTADAYCDKAAPRQELLGAIHRLLHEKHDHRLQPAPVAQASDHGHRTVA